MSHEAEKAVMTVALGGYLRAEFDRPIIVASGCGDARGRDTQVEQAGGSAFLRIPFSAAECLAAIRSCVELNPTGSEPGI